MKYLIFLSLLLFVPSFAYGAEWYDSNWLKMRAIETIPADFNSDLTDYPLYLNITEINVGTDTQADCDDVIVVNYYNTTILPYELENCDTTNNIIELWVKVPTAFSSNTTRVNLYYDYGAATDQQQSQSVWNSNYEYVGHLNGTFVDSTSNGISCSNSGTTAASNELFGDSRSWDAIDDGIDCGDNPADIFDNGGSISAWIKPASDGENSIGRIMTKRSGANSGWSYITTAENPDGTIVTLFFQAWTTLDGQWRTVDRISINNWNHVVVTYNSDSTTAPIIYLNGTSSILNEDFTPSGSAVIDTTENLCLGNNNNLAGCLTAFTWDGEMDEHRMTNNILTANWVSSDFECQRPDGSCITIDNEVTEPTSDTVTVSDEIVLEDSGTTITGSFTTTFSDEIAFEDSGATAASDTVFVSDEIVLEGTVSTIAPPTIEQRFNAIILSLNSPTFDRLGGVFAIVCPSNHTMTGIFSNGTAICTDLSDFFP